MRALLPITSAVFLAVGASKGFGQDADTNVGSPPTTAGTESGSTPAAGEVQLPEVTIETTENPDADPAAKPDENAEAIVESDVPPPARKSKKKASQTALKKPSASAPLSPPATGGEEEAGNGTNPGGDPGVASETNGADALGGPSGFDGYSAKQTTTATKTETPIKDIPQSISIVTKELADDQGSKSLGQALTYVPGVNVAQGEGHRDQLTIRGQQTTADFYVNGVRDDVEYFRDLYNVEAVEVLKGPSAMIFGRGGGGGVVNRSTKSPDGRQIREAVLTGGMFDAKRATVDVGQALSSVAAFRLNAMYEDSQNFRDFFKLERFGINPTLGFDLSDRTKLLVSYEYYSDDRVVDRGIPSRNGRPSQGPDETFFGHPRVNNSDYKGHAASATLEHRFSEDLKIRNHTSFTDADKVYQNTFANSAVSNLGEVNISGYRDETSRQSFINQTDLTYQLLVAPAIRHTFLVGAEFGHQETTNNRDTPHFGTPAGPTSLTVPFSNPTLFTPVFFNEPNRRRNTKLDTYGVYVQDQLEITRYLELIGGIRFDRFDLDFHNGLSDERFARVDNVWSPRGGVVFKPSENISLYGSVSRSFLPSAGDQFNVLNVSSSTLDPEEFENKEIGFKWEVAPRLFFTGALFQLDRVNQVVPSGPLAGQQVGETRTEGGELAVTGNLSDLWQVSASFAHQIAEVTKGRDEDVGKEVPWVPHNTFSLWNKYQFTRAVAAGFGIIHKTSFFAALDNTVETPGYTRVDAALYWTISENWDAQLNIENLFNTDYFVSAHNNNNIMPGAPTSVYVSVGAKF